MLQGEVSDDGAVMPNNTLKLPIQSVTARTCARSAPASWHNRGWLLRAAPGRPAAEGNVMCT